MPGNCLPQTRADRQYSAIGVSTIITGALGLALFIANPAGVAGHTLRWGISLLSLANTGLTVNNRQWCQALQFVIRLANNKVNDKLQSLTH